MIRHYPYKLLLFILPNLMSLYIIGQQNSPEQFGTDKIFHLNIKDNSNRITVKSFKKYKLKVDQYPTAELLFKGGKSSPKDEDFSIQQAMDHLIKLWNDSNFQHVTYPAAKYDLTIKADFDEILEVLEPKSTAIKRIYSKVKFTLSTTNNSKYKEFLRIGYYDANYSFYDFEEFEDLRNIQNYEYIILSAFRDWVDSGDFVDDCTKFCNSIESTPLFDQELIIHGQILESSKNPLKSAINKQVSIFANGRNKSGIIISNDGYILCPDCLNNDGRETIVTFSNGQTKSGKKIRSIQGENYSLIKVDTTGLDNFDIKIPIAVPKIGQQVYTISSPINAKLQGTVTSGIISKIFTGENTTRFQTDASVSFGSEGGALIDENGNFLGILEGVVQNEHAEFLSYTFDVNQITKKLELKFE